MQIDDPRWDEYARLQRMLNLRSSSDDRSAGFEKALDALLDARPETPRGGLAVASQLRVRQTAERGERRRRVILSLEAARQRDLDRVNADTSPDQALHARIDLRRILEAAVPAELALVARLAAEGHARSPSDPAPAAVRKRLERFRRRLAA